MPELREPKLFGTKAEGEYWLDQPEIAGRDEDGNPIFGIGQNARTWLQEPVPVCDLASYAGPPLAAGQFLRDRLNPEEIIGNPEIHQFTQMRQFMQRRHYRVYCVLGDGWDFGVISAKARSTKAYEFMGTRVTGFAHQILKVLLELESALLEKHPELPASGVANFWVSWQVYLFIVVFCTELVVDPSLRELAGDKDPVYLCQQARYFVGKELVTYVREITAGVESQTTAPPRKTGPRPMTEEHLKLKKILFLVGSNWKQPANLTKICRDADEQKIPVPKQWLMGIYLTQVTPRCRILGDGRLSPEFGRVRGAFR